MQQKLGYLCAAIVILTACSQIKTIDELKVVYQKEHAAFAQIAQVACKLKDDANITWFLLRSRLQSTIDTDIHEDALEQLEDLVDEIGADNLVIDVSEKCSLSVVYDKPGFPHEGLYVFFQYQPNEVIPYDANLHSELVKAPSGEFRFHTELDSGWYIIYDFND